MNKFKKYITLTSVIVAGFIYLIVFTKTGMGVPCLIHLRTGFLCPSCGVTRMIGALLRLDFKAAFYYNKLFFIMLPLFIIYFIKFSYCYISDKSIKLSKIENIVLVLLCIVLVLFGILRNII